jgi:hypothetical protein
MNTLLWNWPTGAAVNRTVPKSKFYENAKITNRLRDQFIEEIERITWAYKLSPDTIRLRSSTEVPEIQVFEIQAKPGQVISEPVVAAIDKAIHTPILFEITQADGLQATTCMWAAYKQISVRAPSISGYLRGSQMTPGSQRIPIPTAVDLAALYRGLLAPLFPLPPLPGEPMSDTLDRIEQANRLDREIASLEKAMNTEKQINRKLEIRRHLRNKVKMRENLVTKTTDQNQ